VKCKICEKEFKNLNGISKHISKFHDISSEEYYLKFLGKEELCQECHMKSKFKNLVSGYQKYCSSICCNNDAEKKNLVSEMRKKEWNDNNHSITVRQKISNTIKSLWNDKNSIYHTEGFRKNLSLSLRNNWNDWRIDKLPDICKEYGFELIGSVNDAHSIGLFKCLKCNKEFQTIWNYIQAGKHCPYCCPNGISEAENEIYDFISTKINEEIIRNTTSIISPKELDIFLPTKNIAIEYNGLWSHSANCEWGKKDRKYHLYKTVECEKKNIRLIHIFEDEWLFKKDIVKSRIENILNIQNKEKIYARNCEVKEISTEEKNIFLDQFHLQSSDKSNIKLGLFSNNELVSVMTFSKGKIAKGSKVEEDVWELSRFCSSLNYNVIGSAGKLLTYFKRNFSWKRIFSYADRRWSVGNLYYKIGFNLEHITNPNYWYLKDGKRIHRFSLRKNKEENSELTEFQLRESQGYNWIWDCGNYKFSMINNGGF
jgi:hypothetical protein